jgi:hypothetical protein
MTNIIPTNNQEIIFTFLKVGNAMKVTAVDTQTGIEITMQTPPSLPIQAAKAVATQKLNYVISKRKK